ncbi:prenyltransferase/squalene oxidase repeat-containing protein [Streptomyces sp. NPDC020607]|uniref:prenyltransferase/squalene oxidase repeat-containing protein n=1 Tax=Streptomyces sp. NPDC020607 TaxID=3365082 RepID=UPI0037B18DB5
MDIGSQAPAAYDAACEHLLGLQRDDGSWEGEMEWSTMVLSQYVIVLHLLRRPVEGATRQGAIRYFTRTRTAAGGWGMHPQGPPSPYATTLAYLALRLLGVGPGEPLAADARRWLLTRPGGVRAVPQWGVFWLAVLGLVPYRRVAPVPPEAMLLPSWVPLHPSRMLGWTRMLYQAMAYLYGSRFRADLGPLSHELRAELFPRQEPGGAPEAGTDVPVGRSAALRVLQSCLRGWERVHSRRVRRAALERCHRAVVDEQHASPHHGLSSVNALVECLVLFAHDARHPLLGAAVARLEYWRWSDGERGVRICGDRSTVWDTAFATEALLASGSPTAPDRLDRAVGRAHHFLRTAQITTWTGPTVPARRVRGGWAFSDGHSRWPVADCTAEAVGALLSAEAGTEGHRRTDDAVPPPRFTTPALHDALEVVLRRQNRDGGFATLDRGRAGGWLEILNPTEMFSNCMVDTSSVDCTGSVLHALSRMRPLLRPAARRRADRAIARGVAYLRGAQNRDGSFTGTWGINYTYAAFLAARGLRSAGLASDDPALRALGGWLERTRLRDGGWGEDWRGCPERRYIALEHSLPEMTSWAVLAGLDTLGPAHTAVEGGVRWLCTHQQADGTWPGDHVNGVFFTTMMLNYRLYRAYFPALAVGRYLQAATPRAFPARAFPARAASEGTA